MKISISGIKSLQSNEEYVNLSKLNLITGRNSAGKTSFKVGLELLSGFFKHENNLSIESLFIHKIFPLEYGYQNSMQSIKNGSDLIYNISFGNNDENTLNLCYRPLNDHFQLTNLEYTLENQLVCRLHTFESAYFDFVPSRLIEPYFLIGNLTSDVLLAMFHCVGLLIEIYNEPDKIR